MRKLKKVVCALVLTVLLIAVTVVDGTLLFEVPLDSQMGEAQTSIQATASCLPRVHFRKAQYDDDGALTGCYNQGNDCLIIVFDVAGEEQHLLVTANEVRLR